MYTIAVYNIVTGNLVRVVPCANELATIAQIRIHENLGYTVRVFAGATPPERLQVNA